MDGPSTAVNLMVSCPTGTQSRHDQNRDQREAAGLRIRFYSRDESRGDTPVATALTQKGVRWR